MKTQFLDARAARRAIAILGLLFLLTGILSAQSIDPVHIAPTARSHAANEDLRPHGRSLTANVDLVLVPATVTDTLNHPITTLHQQDFAIYEGGKPQDIKYFNTEDAPISVGILLDTSGSMKTKFDLAREALSEFFANSNRDDDYFVITYSTKPTLLADTTQSVDTIESELSNVTPDGSTPLLDAIYLGLNKLKQARHQRRALLIISDGGDNNSRFTRKEIRAMVQESDVQIYAMGIFGRVNIAIEDVQGKKLLNEISNATGGRAAFFSSPSKMPEVAASFSRELRNQYVLGYRPRDVDHDGKLHKITVKLAATITHPLQVYYKHEYLAAR